MIWQCMWRRTSFCSGLVSRKLCRFLLMFSTGFASLSALLIFPLSITFLIFVRGFHSISSNIDGVLLINPSANVFVFGDFVHHKNWLTYSGGTDRYGELCDASICSTMAFPPFGNSDHVVISVSIHVSLYSQQDAPFHRIAYDFSCSLGLSSWSF